MSDFDFHFHKHICLHVLQLQIISAWISDLVLIKQIQCYKFGGHHSHAISCNKAEESASLEQFPGTEPIPCTPFGYLVAIPMGLKLWLEKAPIL